MQVLLLFGAGKSDNLDMSRIGMPPLLSGVFIFSPGSEKSEKFCSKPRKPL
jgi:hypothetical protein